MDYRDARDDLPKEGESTGWRFAHIVILHYCFYLLTSLIERRSSTGTSGRGGGGPAPNSRANEKW